MALFNKAIEHKTSAPFDEDGCSDERNPEKLTESTKPMSEEEKRKRLSGRAMEYLMFMDDDE